MIWIVMVLGISVDQITKALAATYLPYQASVPIIGDFFSLRYIHNEGAAWSLLSGKVGLLLVVTIVVTLVVAYLLYKTPKEQTLLRFSFALLIAGAVGNIIDRVRLGYVIDFFSFPNFPVFNVADCCVTAAIALIIIATLLDMKKEKKEKRAESEK